MANCTLVHIGRGFSILVKISGDVLNSNASSGEDSLSLCLIIYLKKCNPILIQFPPEAKKAWVISNLQGYLGFNDDDRKLTKNRL